MSVMIKYCGCDHAAQDKMYGKGLRVWNQTKKKPDANGGWKCTVCGKVTK